MIRQIGVIAVVATLLGGCVGPGGMLDWTSHGVKSAHQQDQDLKDCNYDWSKAKVVNGWATYNDVVVPCMEYRGYVLARTR